MSRNLKLSVLLVVLFAAVVAIAAVAAGPPGTEPAAEPGTQNSAAPLVRPDSHRLSTAPDGRVTLVEFLDFECEGCRAAFPVVEQLRETYEGRVTFVARYFPLPSHANAINAAVAVEASAQQGQFEAMYKRMYETQTQWGEQQQSQAAVFRGFAEQLGLDLVAYDKAVADPATRARIKQDSDDGYALGVQGTPTFFLNGERIQPQSGDDLKRLIDDALAD